MEAPGPPTAREYEGSEPDLAIGAVLRSHEILKPGVSSYRSEHEGPEFVLSHGAEELRVR